MAVGEDGISNHLGEDGGVDHEADADHVAYLGPEDEDGAGEDEDPAWADGVAVGAGQPDEEDPESFF